MDNDKGQDVIPELKKYSSAPVENSSGLLKSPPSLRHFISEKLCSLPEEIAKRIRISGPVKGILKKMENSKYLNCSSFQNKQNTKKIKFDLARNHFAKNESNVDFSHHDSILQNPFNFSLTL